MHIVFFFFFWLPKLSTIINWSLAVGKQIFEESFVFRVPFRFSLSRRFPSVATEFYEYILTIGIPTIRFIILLNFDI